MADGAYRLGALAVTIADGVARLTGSDTIAGSTATMDHIFRYAVRHSGLPLFDGVHAAVRQTSANPAAALGLTDVGRLAPGYSADLVVLDDDLTVDGVLRQGSWITAPVGGAVPVDSAAP